MFQRPRTDFGGEGSFEHVVPHHRQRVTDLLHIHQPEKIRGGNARELCTAQRTCHTDGLSWVTVTGSRCDQRTPDCIGVGIQ